MLRRERDTCKGLRAGEFCECERVTRPAPQTPSRTWSTSWPASRPTGWCSRPSWSRSTRTSLTANSASTSMGESPSTSSFRDMILPWVKNPNLHGDTEGPPIGCNCPSSRARASIPARDLGPSTPLCVPLADFVRQGVLHIPLAASEGAQASKEGQDEGHHQGQTSSKNTLHPPLPLFPSLPFPIFPASTLEARRDVFIGKDAARTVGFYSPKPHTFIYLESFPRDVLGRQWSRSTTTSSGARSWSRPLSVRRCFGPLLTCPSSSPPTPPQCYCLLPTPPLS